MNGEKRLLIIAIDEYPQKKDKLANAISDAIALEKILVDRYGFTPSNASPILNEKATRDNIETALHNLHGEINDEDDLIIYYAGHGEQDPFSKNGYWIPFYHEAEGQKQILNSTVLNAVQRIVRAKHILLISDSCFAGTFIPKNRTIGVRPTIDQLDSLRSRWVFASGGEEKVSDGKPGEGSPFSRAVLQFLEKNELPDISAGDLFEWVTKEVKEKGGQVPVEGEIQCIQNEHGQMIFRLSSGAISKLPKVQKPKFPIYPTFAIHHYLSRTVTAYEHQRNPVSYFFEPERGRAFLKDIITLHQRIVLLGTAGSGKSVELRQLHTLLSEETSIFTPVYKKFNTYVDEDIDRYLPTGWETVPKAELVILLDGLDEVQPQYLNTAIRKVSTFSDRNPDLRLIVSCRSNFYELPTANFSGTINGFSVQLLNDVSLFEIRSYAINQYHIDGDGFVMDIVKAGMVDLAQKPFFLKIIIEDYMRIGRLQASRFDIMEGALSSYYAQHREHFNTTGTVIRKDRVYEMLQKIAFVMEVIGKNFISDKELLDIFPDQNDFDNCRYLPALNRDDEKGNWMFEHNNFQEYLASKTIVNKPFDAIIDLISVQSAEAKRVKPGWVNTLSFLMTAKENKIVQQLADWIIQNDIEIIIRFEADRVDAQQRVAIFKSIFEFYEQKGIWLVSNKFSNEDLARFGHSQEILSYLLNKINQDRVPVISKMGAVGILKYFRIESFPDSGENIKMSMLNLLHHKDISSYGIYSVLDAISDLKIYDQQMIAAIVSKYRRHKNQNIRIGLYKILHQSPFLEYYLDVFIEGLDLDSIEDSVEDRENVNNMSESHHLFVGLGKIKSVGNLNLLLNLFSQEGKQYINAGDYKEVLDHIIQNSIAVFKPGNGLFESALKLCVVVNRFFEIEKVNYILPFFDRTQTRWDAFRTIWADREINNYGLSQLVVLFLNDEILEQFLMRYEEGGYLAADLEKLNDIVIWNQEKIKQTDDILLKINRSAKPALRLKLLKPTLDNRNEMYRLRIQKSFDILFSPSELIEEIGSIFRLIGKENIDSEDLRKVRDLNFHRQEQHSTFSAGNLLREFTSSGIKVNESFIFGWISNDPLFHNFQIKEIFNYLSGSYGSQININDDQIAFIKKWTFHPTNNNRILWYFIFRFSIELPEERLLHLTYYYDANLQRDLESPGTIDQLEKFLSRDKILQKVHDNLSKEIPNIYVWSSNASYAIRNKSDKTFSLITEYIKSYTGGDHKMDELLTLWFKISQDTDTLMDLIENVSEDDLRLKAIWLLFNSGKERPFLINYLEQIMNNFGNSIEIRFSAVNYLLAMDQIDAFHFALDYILSNQPSDFIFRNKLHNLHAITQVEALPKLFELLLLSKSDKFKDDPFDDLESIIINAIYNIGIQSSDHFISVKSGLTKFIETNSDAPYDLNYLYLQISRIEEEVAKRSTRNYTVKEALGQWQILMN